MRPFDNGQNRPRSEIGNPILLARYPPFGSASSRGIRAERFYVEALEEALLKFGRPEIFNTD
jgi:hypothetical protein